MIVLDSLEPKIHAFNPDLDPEVTYVWEDIRHLYLDARRANRDLGFEAATGLEEG